MSDHKKFQPNRPSRFAGQRHIYLKIWQLDIEDKFAKIFILENFIMCRRVLIKEYYRMSGKRMSEGNWEISVTSPSRLGNIILYKLYQLTQDFLWFDAPRPLSFLVTVLTFNCRFSSRHFVLYFSNSRGFFCLNWCIFKNNKCRHFYFHNDQL